MTSPHFEAAAAASTAAIPSTSRGLRATLAGAGMLIAALHSAPVSAGVLFSENFSGGTQVIGATGDLPGTVFAVSSGNVDLYDYFFGLNLDLNGNGGGGGAVTTKPGFNVTAGNTYTLNFRTYETFGSVLTFTVGLGTYSHLITVLPATPQNPVSESFSFIAPASAANAQLTLASFDAGTEGPKFIQVSLSETVAAVPEPQTLPLMLAGLGFVAFSIRRRISR